MGGTELASLPRCDGLGLFLVSCFANKATNAAAEELKSSATEEVNGCVPPALLLLAKIDPLSSSPVRAALVVADGAVDGE